MTTPQMEQEAATVAIAQLLGALGTILNHLAVPISPTILAKESKLCHDCAEMLQTLQAARRSHS